jgi:hypothetical protein
VAHSLRSQLAAVCDLALLRWPVHGAHLLALNFLHHIVALNNLRRNGTAGNMQ